MLLLYRRCFKSNLRPPAKGFPYKFNQHPIPEQPYNDLQESDEEDLQGHEELAEHYHSIVEDLFGKDIFRGFAYAYRDLLEAFKDKDRGYLKNVMEPLLFDSIEIPELQLLLPDSPIDCRIIDMEVAFGVLFNRRATPFYKTTMHCLKTEHNQIDMLWYSQIFSKVNPTVTPLLRLAVEFTTKCQLLPAQQPGNDHFTRHTSYFDLVTHSNKMDETDWFRLTRGLQKPTGNSMKKLVEDLNKKGYDWMISDVDNFLEGNRWHNDPLA